MPGQARKGSLPLPVDGELSAADEAAMLRSGARKIGFLPCQGEQDLAPVPSHHCRRVLRRRGSCGPDAPSLQVASLRISILRFHPVNPKNRRAQRRPAKKGRIARKRMVKQAVSQLTLDYPLLLEDLRSRIRAAQTRAALSVNRELIHLYWEIGRRIVERQEREGWGRSVIERLAGDLQQSFPGLQGFSRSNIWRMRSFFLAYREEALREAPRKRDSRTSQLSESKSLSTNSTPILAQPVRELDLSEPPAALTALPWGHNILLIERLKGREHRLWYAQKTAENGWSRAVLVHQI